MKSNKKPQEDRLIGALLRVPYLSVVEWVYKGLIEVGYDDLTYAHLPVFQHINDQTGSRLTDLAEQSRMTKQSMGYLVDNLEDRGYLERVPDPADGRARIILLTKRGEGVMARARELVLEIEEDWTILLGKRRMDQLRETLRELTATLEEPGT